MQKWGRNSNNPIFYKIFLENSQSAIFLKWQTYTSNKYIPFPVIYMDTSAYFSEVQLLIFPRYNCSSFRGTSAHLPRYFCLSFRGISAHLTEIYICSSFLGTSAHLSQVHLFIFPRCICSSFQSISVHLSQVHLFDVYLLIFPR